MFQIMKSRALIFSILSIGASGVSFLMLPIFTRLMVPEDFGLFAVYTLLIGAIAPFISIGMDSLLSVEIVHLGPDEFKSLISSCSYVAGVVTVCVLLLMVIFAERATDLTKLPQPWVAAAIVCALVQALSSVVIILAQMDRKFVSAGLMVFGQAIFANGSVLILVMNGVVGWKSRAIGILIGSILTFLIGIFVSRNRLAWPKIPSKEHLTGILKFGLPLIPYFLSGIFMTYGDRIILANKVGIGETGLYSVGHQVGWVLAIVSSAMTQAMTPWIYQQLRLNTTESKIKLTKSVFIYWLSLPFFALCLSFCAKYGAGILLGRKFEGSAGFVFWISMGFAFRGMYLPICNLLYYHKKTALLSYIACGAAVVHLIAVWTLVTALGAVGAALAATISFATLFLASLFALSRASPIPWREALREAVGFRQWRRQI